jgi:hypothetical protein
VQDPTHHAPPERGEHQTTAVDCDRQRQNLKAGRPSRLDPRRRPLARIPQENSGPADQSALAPLRRRKRRSRKNALPELPPEFASPLPVNLDKLLGLDHLPGYEPPPWWKREQTVEEIFDATLPVEITDRWFHAQPAPDVPGP